MSGDILPTDKSNARLGRNPATGEQIKIPARTRLRFIDYAQPFIPNHLCREGCMQPVEILLPQVALRHRYRIALPARRCNTS